MFSFGIVTTGLVLVGYVQVEQDLLFWHSLQSAAQSLLIEATI